MGVFGKREESGDEQEPGGSSPWVDLGLRACPVCRRELMGWEERCPDDGAEGVRQADLSTGGLPPVPDHLLDDDTP